MTDDYDIDWLTQRRPKPPDPASATTDRARASLIAHGTRQRRRRRGTAAIGALSVLAVAGAAVAVTGGGAAHPAGGPPPAPLATVPRTAVGGMTSAVPRTPLIRLAADVRLMPSTPQPGDATLVVRDTVLDGVHEIDGAVYGGYDLYTDSGQYYYAPDSLAQLQQQVDTHQTVADNGNEAKALDTIAGAANGTPAQAREATLSTFPHGLGPMPTPAQVRAFDHKMERLTRRRLPYVAPTQASWTLTQDSDLWIAATEALAVGAGRSDVRAGAMKALSTITGVTQTPTEVDGVSALRVGFPDDGQPEIIWLNADTGVPVQEKDGSNSATTFEVERVTAADLPSQISRHARLH